MRSSAQRSIFQGENGMQALCTIVFAGFGAALTGCSMAPTQVASPLANAAGNRLVLVSQARSHGWMLPDTKSADLLYVSDSDNPGRLLAFSYPTGELVGEVTVPSAHPVGLCSAGAGDVFVPTGG